MDAEFWHERWETNQLGFHQEVHNPMMVAHADLLELKPGERVFLPLCGKTLDIGWFLSNGHHVLGAELSELAIEQLFDNLQLVPERTPVGKLVRYSAENIDIFVGDIFSLTPETLGPVQAIYDRAALIALPADMRRLYAEHLVILTQRAPQLLVSVDYDQSEMAGPPFSVVDEEIKQLYAPHYEVTKLASADVPGGLKGICKADQTAWLLL
ncbi:MAG: thiopurine S-methyltransferase [Pseudomonadota bacterium]